MALLYKFFRKIPDSIFISVCKKCCVYSTLILLKNYKNAFQWNYIIYRNIIEYIIHNNMHIYTYPIKYKHIYMLSPIKGEFTQ